MSLVSTAGDNHNETGRKEEAKGPINIIEIPILGIRYTQSTLLRSISQCPSIIKEEESNEHKDDQGCDNRNPYKYSGEEPQTQICKHTQDHSNNTHDNQPPVVLNKWKVTFWTSLIKSSSLDWIKLSAMLGLYLERAWSKTVSSGRQIRSIFSRESYAMKWSPKSWIVDEDWP